MTRNLISLFNDGINIKKHMKNYYNEMEHAETIEIIFNKIIIKQFASEYERIAKCVNTHQNQGIVFNTDDLMCAILGYLEYNHDTDRIDGDLFACILVCSHWLYHVWNPNSIYYLCLDSLMDNTLQCTKKHLKAIKVQ